LTFIPESCKDCTQKSIWIREPDRLFGALPKFLHYITNAKPTVSDTSYNAHSCTLLTVNSLFD